MSSIVTRRSLLRGLFAAPAIVAVASLMPIRGIIMPTYTHGHTIVGPDNIEISKMVNSLNESEYFIGGVQVDRVTWARAMGPPYHEAALVPIPNHKRERFAFIEAHAKAERALRAADRQARLLQKIRDQLAAS